MTTSDFFKQLSTHLLAKLPFVVYRKPNEVTVKAMLQQEDTLFYTEQFTDSGFVFSPFKNEGKTVLFPLKKNSCIACVFDENLQTKKSTNASLLSSIAKKNHVTLVEKAITEIEAGRFKKVVLSRVEVAGFNSQDLLLLFKKLLAHYKTAMVYCWYHPKVGLWLGATPETLLKVEGNRFLTMSLAGTQPFKNDTKVLWQSKEQEEQQLVTDYIVASLTVLDFATVSSHSFSGTEALVMPPPT